MRTGVISGSHREGSQSFKVARYVADRLRALELCPGPKVITMADRPFDFWNEESHKDETWRRVYQAIRPCDSFVIVSPEWDGMVPAALKNFFHMFTEGEVAHKPALLVGVSASVNGAYPISELRMSSYKNTRICYVPEQIIIRYVEQVLNVAEPARVSAEEAILRRRIDYALKLLGHYADALERVRDAFDFEWGTYPYGM